MEQKDRPLVPSVYDNSGNKGIAISAVPLTGGGTPIISVCGSNSTTNASSIYDLGGWGTNGGGSLNLGFLPIGAGVEYNEGNGYSGKTITVGGKGNPFIAEVHANKSYTWVFGW